MITRLIKSCREEVFRKKLTEHEKEKATADIAQEIDDIFDDIKKTKKNMALLAIVEALLLVPVIFCIYIWIYRSGWSDGFKAYVSEQGCNWDTLIDSLLGLVYALAPFIFLLIISTRMQLRSLRGYQDECEHLGLKRNGAYIEK